MAKLKQTIRSFNAGYMSRSLSGRSDHPKYAFGCRQIDNWITTIQGPAYRRSGTKFIAAAAIDDKYCRMIGFVHSTSEKYILEFGDYYIRFFIDDGQLLDGQVIYEIPTPFSEAEVAAIQTEQLVDIMYIVTGARHIYKLSRYDHTDWRLTECRPTDGPFEDQNTTAAKLAVSLPDWTPAVWPAGEQVISGLLVYECTAATTIDTLDPPSAGGNWISVGTAGEVLEKGWTVQLTATGDEPFAAESVGRLYQLIHTRKENSYSGEFDAAYNETVPDGSISPDIDVYGPWEFRTHGHWGGTVQMQRWFDDSSTWEPYRTYRSVYDFTTHAGDNNVAVMGEQEERAKYRIVMTGYDGADGVSNVCQWDFSVHDYTYKGIVRVTDYINSTAVTAVVIAPVASSQPVSRFSAGAWSDQTCYPSSICLWKGRLAIAAKTTLWLSTPIDWESFAATEFDDSAIRLPIPEARADSILWLCDKGDLCLGSEGSEIVIKKLAKNEPVSSTNLTPARQGGFGSEPVKAVICGNKLFYVQRSGAKLREFGYSYEQESYISNDMTMLADDIAADGIIEVAAVTLPAAQLWCLTAAGEVMILTAEPAEDVIGWSKFITDGIVESICSIPGPTADQVWMVIRRTIAGSEKRFVERIDLTKSKPQKDEWRYLDSYLETSSEQSLNVVSGLEHLEGRTVQVFGDGAYQGERVVAAGSVVLQVPAKNIAVGIKYKSILSPMSLDIAGSVSAGPMKKNLIKCIMDLTNTGAIKYGTSLASLEKKDFMASSTLAYNTALPVDEPVEMSLPCKWSRKADLFIVCDEPVAATVVSITPDMQLN